MVKTNELWFDISLNMKLFVLDYHIFYQSWPKGRCVSHRLACLQVKLSSVLWTEGYSKIHTTCTLYPEQLMGEIGNLMKNEGNKNDKQWLTEQKGSQKRRRKRNLRASFKHVASEHKNGKGLRDS